ncbi:hypothetical protein J587_0243 [Acinetobacter baumannii 144107]|nr:hypothetical protein J587_0243 [Acinetobacter baumannii 144107]EXG92715.1 hypothetical protein J624_0371 [Acinetobacter baumannii 1062314]
MKQGVESTLDLKNLTLKSEGQNANIQGSRLRLMQMVV